MPAPRSGCVPQLQQHRLVVRGIAEVIDLERATHTFFEPDLQAFFLPANWLMDFANQIYMNSQFAVVLGFFFWLYFFRNESFYFVRNMFAVSMGLALVGYTLYPTAPPRFFTEYGFVDTINDFSSVNHDSALVKVFINPYAALPSFHAGWTILAALVVAGTLTGVWRHVVLATLPWMPVAVVVTANHYVVDVLLGVALSLVALAVAARLAGGLRPAPARARAAPASAAGPHGHPHAVAAPDGKG